MTGLIVAALAVVLVLWGVATVERPMEYKCRCGKMVRVGDGHSPCESYRRARWGDHGVN